MNYAKQIIRLSIIASVALAVGVPLALAHSPDGEKGAQCEGRHGKKDGKFKAKMLKKFDVNNDGVLDSSEKEAAMSARKAKRAEALASYDQDGDGQLSKEEKRALRADRQIKKFEKLDANGDSEISLEEASFGHGRLAGHFDKVDTDGNGTISWAEFEQGAKRSMKKRRAHRGHFHGPRGAQAQSEVQ